MVTNDVGIANLTHDFNFALNDVDLLIGFLQVHKFQGNHLIRLLFAAFKDLTERSSSNTIQFLIKDDRPPSALVLGLPYFAVSNHLKEGAVCASATMCPVSPIDRPRRVPMLHAQVGRLFDDLGHTEDSQVQTAQRRVQ